MGLVMEKNNKNITKSIFDLFEQVKRQSSMYNDAFNRLEYNSKVFEQLVIELKKINTTMKVDSEDLAKQNDDRISAALRIIKDERELIISELAGVKTLNDSVFKYEEKYEELTNNLIKGIKETEQEKKKARQYLNEIRKITKQFNLELETLKSSLEEILQTTKEEMEEDVSKKIEKHYRELELLINNRQSIFEHRLITYYETNEHELFATQKKIQAVSEDMYNKINVLENMASSKHNQDQIFWQNVNEKIETFGKEVQNLLITTQPIADISSEELIKVVQEIKGPDLVRKSNVNSIIDKKLVEYDNKMSTISKKNNASLVLSIIAIIILLGFLAYTAIK